MDPGISDDDIGLGGALDFTGRQLFGPQWTGAEIGAKPVPAHLNEFASAYRPPSLRAPAWGGRLFTLDGPRDCDMREAIAYWQAEKPRRDEAAATRSRLEAAIRALSDKLSDGGIVVQFHDFKTGDYTRMPSHFWRSTAGMAEIERGTAVVERDGWRGRFIMAARDWSIPQDQEKPGIASTLTKSESEARIRAAIAALVARDPDFVGIDNAWERLRDLKPKPTKKVVTALIKAHFPALVGPPNRPRKKVAG